MGLGKPQLHAKFEVAGFIYYGNIKESVFKQQIRFLSHPLGKLVVTSSIARWKSRSRLPIRDNWTFLLLLTADALIRRKRLCWRGWTNLGLNIRFKGYISRQYIYTVRYGNGSATTVPLKVFTEMNFVAGLFDLNWFSFTKVTNLLFEPPLGDLGVYSSLESAWPTSYLR